MPDTLGFDTLLADDGLFARLLGTTRTGRHRRPLHGPDLPVVILVGGPGMGKGRLLRCIREEFGPYVPTAQIDCGSSVHRARAAQNPATRTEATEALRELALQLHAWQGPGGAVATPRLYAGLVAVASGGEPGGAESLAEVQRHEGLLPPGSFWRGVLKKAVKGYLSALGGLVAGQATVPFTTAVLDELFARVSPEGNTALEECYGAYPGAGGQPKLGLHTLAGDFRQDGATREQAEGFLFRALRHDVEAAYGGAHGWLLRTGRPALLLDRADCALGRHLLKPVLEDREAGRHDRTLVVATARREDGGRFLHGPGRSGLAADGAQPWNPGEGGLPRWSRPPGGVPGLAPLARGTLLVRMPVLTPEQQRDETARTRNPGQRPDNSGPMRIDAGVHRLSAGRPSVVVQLARATGALRSPRSHWELLDAPIRPPHETHGDGRSDRPVADVLLDELIDDHLPEELPPEYRGVWLDVLSHLSVAHGTECAQLLMDERKAAEHRDEHLSAYQIAELLADSGWPGCPRHFIGDLGLRHLLLRRLYRLERGGGAWRRDHELLWRHYRAIPGDAPDDLFGSAVAHGLHHRLAAGDERAADAVVDHLDRTVATRDTAQWAAELLGVAEAPFLAEDRDDRRATALGRITPPGDVRRRRIARVLHAVRLCEDRMHTADPEVAGALRRHLHHLGDESSHGTEVLVRLAGDWEARAAAGQPLKPCVCTQHLR
ncbi:hypothetical protein RM572_21525 [Streptomyces sp. DSM 42041]|uniref:ATP-binding protein n=1 Tax=Streptomyces hazeniae TaxID=3075538 RepID=A0ABU2NWI4_9ACTN|nr:hypothetical protein [Streptomyces sp. DSM 42041]MDT0381342.1 hypothetical protein [Streptomyces sp. DSM 42041]